jgi:hypothetical protein
VRCVGCLDNCPRAGIPFCLAEGLAAAAAGDAEGGLLFCCDAFAAQGSAFSGERAFAGEEVLETAADLFRRLSAPLGYITPVLSSTTEGRS